MRPVQISGLSLALLLTCGSGAIVAQSPVPTPGPAPGVIAEEVVAASTLGFGDAIRITVWLHPELSGEFGITSAGTVAEPFYMDVRVAGLPLAEVAEQIRNRVRDLETNSRVLVEPLFSVGVGGEVRQPNLYTLPPETTVMQAIMLAGGPSRPFDQVRIHLERDGQRVRLGPGDAEVERIGSGDRIVLTRRTRVFGDVVVPTLNVLGSVASIIRLARIF